MRKGFTLIELMTAVSIFLVIMVISMGTVLSVYDSNRKARSQRTTLNTLNVILDRISREMRYGSMYYCGTAPWPITAPQDCSNLGSPGTSIGFYDSSGTQKVYTFAGNVISTTVQNGASVVSIPLTQSPVTIDSLSFNVSGTASDDGLQPKVLIRITGRSGSGDEQTVYKVQTLVTQRRRDS